VAIAAIADAVERLAPSGALALAPVVPVAAPAPGAADGADGTPISPVPQKRHAVDGLH
jgi:hypothetical protein